MKSNENFSYDIEYLILIENWIFTLSLQYTHSIILIL